MEKLRKKYTITKPDVTTYENIRKHWDTIAKPLDGLGKFEKIIACIGAAQETIYPDISKRAVIVMCADNGIVDEGVSQSGKEVTLAVARSMGKRKSSVCLMAKAASADVIPVDVGIASTEKIEGVEDRKISCGTKNFAVTEAMTDNQAMEAIDIGVSLVKRCKNEGYGIIAIGEMGIANTTTSSAVIASLLHLSAEAVTGRGAGLDDAGLKHKQNVIKNAISRYHLYDADALTVLKSVGGLDIAALAGVCIGGAMYHIPIVLDGLISAAAALVAEKIINGTEKYLIASHVGKEMAIEGVLKQLHLEPVIYADLALGEGTGAVMMFSLLDMALAVYNSNVDFSKLEIKPYKRFENDKK